MILYFADRHLNILGQASTSLPNGLLLDKDNKIADVETGVSTFECNVAFDSKTRANVEAFTATGNYILRKHGLENDFFQIVEREIDNNKQQVYIYAEDDGMDLLNEVVGAYEADKAYSIEHYVKKYAAGSGFEIGINEVPSLTRKLSWDGESTATERIASVATQFDGCEVSYTFEIDGLHIVKKYINIHEKRGKDIGIQLRMNQDIDSIITTESITNVATALKSTGGTIDQDSKILEKTSNSVTYKVDLETASRTANTAKINATVSAALTNKDAEFGEEYGLKASIYMGGTWHSATIKATDKENKQNWSGTVSHSTEYSFTISGVAAGVATYSDIQFKVERTDSKGGSTGVLAATTCAKFTIPNYIAGGENGEDINTRPITLEGYKYDDGDFYVDGNVLKSRKALQSWSRLVWKTEESQRAGGHITKLFSFDTESQKTLCEKTITELKKLREMEVNYEVELTRLPDNVKVGDRVNIIDDAGELYLSTRILLLETSVADQESKATLGEHLIKGSGISQRVADLAEQFAKNSLSAQRAMAIAKNATANAAAAQNQADAAVESAEKAKTTANEAATAADNATQTAEAAQTAADTAQAAVEVVGKSVESLETTVTNAQAAADNAHQAAQTATQKADEAKEAAENAADDAATAKEEAENAKDSAANAVEKASMAENKATEAKAQAASAILEANAAKEDAKKAEEEIAGLGNSLTTLSQTMKADYSRKTDLTEAAANLQTQIAQNAAGIKSNAFKYVEIDETANNAGSKVEAAQKAALAAQEYADQASLEAQATAMEAEGAAAAAQAALNEANTARQAANDARAVADQAKADLDAAKADLLTVQSRADATEEEIAAAQEAVAIATEAANQALIVADQATAVADNAQDLANAAVDTATKAQATANAAASAATLAQKLADETVGNAAAIQQRANEAAEIANNAQATANTARATADTAKSAAEEAATNAANADKTAQEAKEKALQEKANLESAQQHLSDVLANVNATQEEINAAYDAVDAAIIAADNANTAADAAEATAAEAKARAEEAQAAADLVEAAAENAQQAAKEAQTEADLAQGIVNALERRTTAAETSIEQTAESVVLSAKENKAIADALSERLASAEAALKVLSDSIQMLVRDANGESQMVQDSTSATWAFNTQEIDQAISDTAAGLGELENALGGTKEAVDALKATLDSFQDRVQITTYENEPCIILFDETNYKKIITNTRCLHIKTTNDVEEVIGEEDFETLRKKRVEVEEAQIGKWVWKQRANGNLCLIWESEVEE